MESSSGKDVSLSGNNVVTDDMDGGQKTIPFHHRVSLDPSQQTPEQCAELIRELANGDVALVPAGGKTSSGVLGAGWKPGQKVALMNTPLITENLESCVQVNCDDTGNPVLITVPANVTLSALKGFLKDKYPKFTIDAHVTTEASSTVGANFVSGARGDNRKVLPVSGATVIRGNGTVDRLEGEGCQALRRTHGYAGFVHSLTIPLSPRLPDTTTLMVPLGLNPKTSPNDEAAPDSVQSEIIQAYARDFGLLIRQLVLSLGGGDGVVRLEGAEILDQRGVELIARELYKGQDILAVAREGLKNAPAAVLLRFAHEGELFDQAALAPFLEGEATSLLQHATLFMGSGEKQIITIREMVPEAGRKLAANKDTYSQSLDADVLLLATRADTPIETSDLQDAWNAQMRVYADLIREVSEIPNSRWMGNGHLLGVAPELAADQPRAIQALYNVRGGSNPHFRFFVPTDGKAALDQALQRFYTKLAGLHGRSFGTVTLWTDVLGEKAYPNKPDAWTQFAQNAPSLHAAVLEQIARGGDAFNFRAPQHLRPSTGSTSQQS